MKRCGKLAAEKNLRSSRSPISDSRTVLPAPKLLDLIGIRADANITSSSLCESLGQYSSLPSSVREAIRKDPLPVHEDALTDLPWQGVPVILSTSIPEGSSATRQSMREDAIFAELRVPGVGARYGRRTPQS